MPTLSQEFGGGPPRSERGLFVACIALFGLLSIWSSPNLPFLSFAFVSAAADWLIKSLWRKPSSWKLPVQSFVLLIPYLIASELVDIPTHRLLLVQYLALAVATNTGLSWMFARRFAKEK